MRLRVITAAVYAGIAISGVAVLAPQLRRAAAALVSRFSYLPDLAWPWLWLSLGLLLAWAVADAVRRIAGARRVGQARYVTILAFVGAAFLARNYAPVPGRAAVADGIAHLVARVELASDTAYHRDKQYTDQVAELTASWPPELRDLGFFRRGAIALRTRLTVVHDTWGPVLAPPPASRPGDIVLALSRDRRSYWITSYDLDRAGRITVLVDERGRAVVASAANGYPASRLDSLFPDYPNKASAPSSPPQEP